MSVNVTLNGTTFTLPEDGETNWGPVVTSFFQAIANGTLQKVGGNFSLNSEVNTGATYGFKVPYIKSQATNPAAAGALRLGNTDTINFRNAGNSADIPIGVDSSGNLTVSGAAVQQAITVTPSRALASDSSGKVAASPATSTELGYLSGVTSAVQTQLAAKADSSSLTAHTGASTGVHGVTGSVVGSTDTQTLLNKTLNAPVVDALSMTEIGTPTSPSSGTRKVYVKSDGKAYILNSSGVETSLGSGTGDINFVTISDGGSTTGWATYQNTAQSSPVSGTGGTPTVSFGVSSASPLAGTSSFLFTKPASNVQGQGVSYSFTIDSAYQAKVMQIGFTYQVSSGTFNAGTSSTDSDVTVWILDVTNNVLIQPSNYKLFSNSSTISDFYQGTFQTASNSTSYRLIVHVGVSTTNTFILKFDDVKVSPSKYVYGSPITDWVPYTPTFTGFGTVTSVSFYSKRMGDSLYVRGAFTAGTTTATQAQITLGYGGGNANVSIDTTKTSTSYNQLAGLAVTNGASATYFTSDVLAPLAGGSYVLLGQQSSSAAGTTAVNGNAYATGGVIEVSFIVPILGWSSSVSMSNDTDTRVVAARAFASTGASMGTLSGSASVVTYNTTVNDTHGAWSGNTYTVPVSGYYDFFAGSNQVATLATNQIAVIQIFKNGSVLQTGFSPGNGAAGISYPANVSVLSLYCNAGDTIQVKAFNSGTTVSYASSTDINFFTAKRVSGPTAIAATESMNETWGLTSAQAVSANAPIKYDTKVKSTHGLYSTSTGLLTAQSGGQFRISVVHQSNLTSGNLYVKVNGVSVGYLCGMTGPVVSGSISVSVLAGQTVGVYTDSAATFTATGTNGYINQVTFERTGN